KAIDEIHGQVPKSCPQGIADRPIGFLARMNPVHPFQVFVKKGLDANAQPVDRGFPAESQLSGSQVVRIRLQGDFTIGRKHMVLADRIQQSPQLGSIQQRRRSSSQVNAGHLRPREVVPAQADFLHQRFQKLLAPSQIGAEMKVTIVTGLLTKGNVNVYSRHNAKLGTLYKLYRQKQSSKQFLYYEGFFPLPFSFYFIMDYRMPADIGLPVGGNPCGKPAQYPVCDLG